MKPGGIGIWVIGGFSLIAFIGCEAYKSDRRLPPPPGASVHESPSHAGSPAPQGAMPVPAPIAPDKGGDRTMR